MNCPNCQAPGVLVESSADGKTKTLKCQKCGMNEVRDNRDKPLLTGAAAGPSGQLLLEG